VVGIANARRAIEQGDAHQGHVAGRRNGATSDLASRPGFVNTTPKSTPKNDLITTAWRRLRPLAPLNLSTRFGMRNARLEARVGALGSAPSGAGAASPAIG
jgi:hypothetical protein